jgi:hypothetical protein
MRVPRAGDARGIQIEPVAEPPEADVYPVDVAG